MAPQRHLVDHQGLKALPQALQLGDWHTGADPARIDEFAFRCVVAEKQRPDAMSTAFGITPSDNDKFLSVEALDLEPRTPVGLVAAIRALRHDALKAVLTGQPVELWAMADLVVVVSQRVRRTI